VSTPRSDDPTAILALREALERVPFTGEAIRDMLGSEDDILSRLRDIPVHLRRLRSRGSAGALVQLLVLNVPVDAEILTPALAPLTLDAAERLGILRREAGQIDPLVRLVPHDDVIVCSDTRLVPGQPAPHDHVPGVHRPTVTLAKLTVRTPVQRGLDLGTGSGVEAILMRAHVAHVVGSDVNARAIEFARFNGILNRAPDIDWRVGSWFAPMRDERFDVIASNPPYVISPSSQYIYRDSGMEGDSVSEQVVREVAAHLTEGGFGTVAISWAAEPGETEAKAVQRWLANSGCDAWVLHYRTEEPLSTAKTWNENDIVDPAAYGRVLDEWMAYYARLGISAIGYGSIVIRRRTTSKNWFRVDQFPGGRLDAASDHIRRVFDANDHLQSADDDDLLRSRFRVPAALRVVRTVSVRDPDVAAVHLSLEEGVGFQAEIDDHIANVLALLDGATLREALNGAAEAGGLAARDRERFVTAGATLARRLYAMGFIERASDSQR